MGLATNLSGNAPMSLSTNGPKSVATALDTTRGATKNTTMNYTVVFTESDLPSMTEWWVNLTNGDTNNSKTGFLTLNESDGSYDYSVATVDKEYWTHGGSFNVDGTLTAVSVTFSLYNYTASFQEGGLHAGTTWVVTINGTNIIGNYRHSSTMTQNNVSLANGTYDYHLNIVSGYIPKQSPNGTFTIFRG